MNEPKLPLTFEPGGRPVCPCREKPMHRNGFKRKGKLKQQWKCAACRRTAETVVDGASVKQHVPRTHQPNAADHRANIDEWIRAGLSLLLPLAVDYLIKVAARPPLDTGR